MIAINSESYPYLSVAQRHGVKYGEVLEVADSLDELNDTQIDSSAIIADMPQWIIDTERAWKREQHRRQRAHG